MVPIVLEERIAMSGGLPAGNLAASSGAGSAPVSRASEDMFRLPSGCIRRGGVRSARAAKTGPALEPPPFLR
jgi:hypothetical protein